jgi:TolA-binding protein
MADGRNLDVSVSHQFSGKFRLLLTVGFGLSTFCGPLAAEGIDLNNAEAKGRNAYKAGDYDVAIENLAAVAKNPAGATEGILYELGFAYFFKEQYQEAVTTFELFTQKFPTSKNSAEANLTLGQSLIKLGSRAEEALGYLAKAAARTEFAEEARFLAATAYLEMGDTEKAAKMLQTAMSANASGANVLRLSLELIDAYIKAEDYDKAIDALKKIAASASYPDVIVQVNYRFVQIGDRLLESRDYISALEAFSGARPRAQVIAIQTKRLAVMGSLKETFAAQIAAAEKSKQALPIGTKDKAAALEAMIKNTATILGDVRDRADYDTTLQYRIGRCYFNMERYWPASVAFEAVALENPKAKDAPTSLFGAIMSHLRLKRPAVAGALCDIYLKEYPKEKQAEQVYETKATLLLQEGKNTETVAFLEPYFKENPISAAREKLLTLLANARLQAGDYLAAAGNYEALRKEFPTSTASVEEWTYRRALCDFLRNDYDATLKSFAAYEKDYPDGTYRADLRYRMGFILLAKKDYDGLITSMRALLRDPNSEANSGQIHALLGDALLAKGAVDDAATEFAAAVRTAGGDKNVIDYAIEQASSLLRGGRRWNELQVLWQDTLKQNSDSPLALRAVSELSKLLSRDNKKDEARALLKDYALRDIHNMRSENVETLLSQLASLYLPARTFKKDVAAPSTDELIAQLGTALDIPEAERTLPYLARVNYAKSELARMLRDPQRNSRFLNAIASSSKPEDLGPVLLSSIGQFLLEDRQLEKAVPFFTRLREAFPDSNFSDAAPVGLGRIAMAQKNYELALTEFDDAINGSKGGSMVKEAAFGKALALFSLKRLPAAKKGFQEIVDNKEWRGLEKAGAVFYLGEVAAQSGDRGAANLCFQKVYLTHGAYPEYALKAYLRSADMLEESGDHAGALDAYRRLLKIPKFADTSEAKIARQKAEQ